MKITLKNGEVVKLDWNWLVIERIEEEIDNFGDIEKIAKLQKRKRKIKFKDLKGLGVMKSLGTLSYAIVQANLDKEYERNQLIRLIEQEDIERIIDFMFENEKEIANVVDIKK